MFILSGKAIEGVLFVFWGKRGIVQEKHGRTPCFDMLKEAYGYPCE